MKNPPLGGCQTDMRGQTHCCVVNTTGGHGGHVALYPCGHQQVLLRFEVVVNTTLHTCYLIASSNVLACRIDVLLACNVATIGQQLQHWRQQLAVGLSPTAGAECCAACAGCGCRPAAVMALPLLMLASMLTDMP
jgi:hypothetical protein